MTHIPDAAVDAMFDAMEDGHDPFTTDPLFGSPAQIRAAIRNGLAAALPFLGETEYSVRRADGSVIADPTGIRALAAVHAADTGGTLVQRPVFYGEWTEAAQ
jgi:hypothetical protein